MATTATPPAPGTYAPGGAPPPNTTAPPAAVTGYPWDQLTAALQALIDAEPSAGDRVKAAGDAYSAIKDAPIGDPLTTSGAVSAEAKTAALNAYVQAGNDLVALKNRQAQTAADIAQAKQAYNDAQDKAALTPQTIQRLNADTEAARQQALVYGAQATLAKAQTDQLTSPAGQAAQTAKTRVENAQAALYEAQKGQIGANNGLIAAQTAEASSNAALTGAKAGAYPAESGAGITLSQAQAAAAQATAAATAQATREHQLGALGTYIEQETRAAAAGLITKEQAEADIAAFAKAQQTGATPYEWQQQADANARAISGQIIQSGGATAPGQQYMAGAEPGGILQQAAAQWGFTVPSVHLRPVTAPAYMQSLGMTVGTPPQVGGQVSPAGAPVQGGPPAYAQSLPSGIPDYSHLSLAEIEALHAPLVAARQGGAPNGPAPTGATAPTGYVPNPMGRANAVPVPTGATMGGVNNGLALGPIITGAPNYARLPGT